MRARVACHHDVTSDTKARAHRTHQVLRRLVRRSRRVPGAGDQAITGLVRDEAELMRAVHIAMEPIAWVVIVPSGIARSRPVSSSRSAPSLPGGSPPRVSRVRRPVQARRGRVRGGDKKSPVTRRNSREVAARVQIPRRRAESPVDRRPSPRIASRRCGSRTASPAHDESRRASCSSSASSRRDACRVSPIACAGGRTARCSGAAVLPSSAPRSRRCVPRAAAMRGSSRPSQTPSRGPPTWMSPQCRAPRSWPCSTRLSAKLRVSTDTRVLGRATGRDACTSCSADT